MLIVHTLLMTIIFTYSWHINAGDLKRGKNDSTESNDNPPTKTCTGVSKRVDPATLLGMNSLYQDENQVGSFEELYKTISQPLYRVDAFNSITDIPPIKRLFENNWKELMSAKQSESILNNVLSTLRNNQSFNKRQAQEVNIRVIKNSYSYSRELVGFITYALYEKYPTLNLTGHIDFLAVDPNHRKNKLGTTLIKHAMTELAAKGAQSVDLYVWNQNKAAIKCYERLGFTITGSTPPDNYFMEKELH